MTLLGRLLLLFIVVPLIELVFLIQVGRWVGIWPTVGLVFLTGFVGAALARAEGLRTLWAFRRDLGEGRLPGRPLLDGLAILVGGALLLTPGFLTDIVGFALLAPPTRSLLQRWVRRRLQAMIDRGEVRVVNSFDLFGGGFGPREAPGSPSPSGAGEDGEERELDPEKEISG